LGGYIYAEDYHRKFKFYVKKPKGQYPFLEYLEGSVLSGFSLFEIPIDPLAIISPLPVIGPEIIQPIPVLPVVGIPNAIGTFQSPATLVMDGIMDLHYDIMGVMCAILALVLYMLTIAIWSSRVTFDENIITTTTHNTLIEII